MPGRGLWSCWGLSPRVRGNHDRLFIDGAGCGSIPACAGEPPGSLSIRGRYRVYPRVCGGGTRRRLRQRGLAGGLSPRVRGNRCQLRLAMWALRSIPACAGNRGFILCAPSTRGSIPACAGEPLACQHRVGRCQGLSPRVRGNLAGTAGGGDFTGSIPACAGEPLTRVHSRAAVKVYPRVCGGTLYVSEQLACISGLSPRVRGTQGQRLTTASGRVYPRVCGGTDKAPHRMPVDKGLSPRVRGNRPRAGGTGGKPWSIPACAGEPHCDRSCGRLVSGLSPRVRGNRASGVHPQGSPRSIPACAGEPSGRALLSGIASVYPRVCGGTRIYGEEAAGPIGLSPRVRGNRLELLAQYGGEGSIPACAGGTPG